MMEGIECIKNCGSVQSYSLTTHAGIMEMVSCINGLHALRFISDSDADGEHKAVLQNVQKSDIPITLLKQKDLCDLAFETIFKTIDWLNVYYTNPCNIKFMALPPVCASVLPKKGSFQEVTWTTLLAVVPFGKTVTYSQLAILMGKPGASRAVGNAMSKNPIMLIIPCHRVINSDGKCGQYQGGQFIKKWLLKHESLIIDCDIR